MNPEFKAVVVRLNPSIQFGFFVGSISVLKRIYVSGFFAWRAESGPILLVLVGIYFKPVQGRWGIIDVEKKS
jgi:hypothetical protein